MTAGARLLSVRLQGFKSFAGRTTLEFGPGISAVVGPNGAGKSNLADALRWTFGEQGRALRSRRAEDIIFAGSEGRSAVGMADVTVVVDNADGLLPVDYSVVELGRRLFRSGENEYLLNGTRVRLRDLEELLDAAHLADNAFLFIGQGMVDQALALRPEERRPLFEEVAGVRRHERRKRAAQTQLQESEANLARVGDLLAEMRPRARRLAVQARQQAARSEAASALAEGIVASGRVGWHEAATRLGDADHRRHEAQTEIDAAIADLRAADEAIATAGDVIDERLHGVRDARSRLDEARAALADARVGAARGAAELEARNREHARLERERTTLEERIVVARRRLALPAPVPPGEREEEPEAPGPTPRTTVEDRQTAARERLAALRRGQADEDAEFEAAVAEETGAEGDAERARVATDQASTRAAEARAGREAQGERVAGLSGRREAAETSQRSAVAQLAGIRERLAVLGEHLAAAGAGDAISGAQPLTRGLRVEARLQAAVEAVLGAAAEALLVASDALGRDGPRGTIVLSDLAGPPLAPGEGADGVLAASREGGGLLLDGLEADPTGIAARLLRRSVWVPDREAAVRVARLLAPGWTVATANGERLGAEGVLEAPRKSQLAFEEERSRLSAQLPAAEKAFGAAEAALAESGGALARARQELTRAEGLDASAQAAHDASVREQSRAERRHELAAREAAWARVQRERHEAEVGRLEAIVGAGAVGPVPGPEVGVAWAAYREALRERQRLEGSLAADVARLETFATELAVAAGSLAAAGPDRERITAHIAGLEAAVAERAAALAQLDAGESAERQRLDAAERTRRAVRDRIQAAEGRSRASEIDELQARMTLDGVRERLLVELASLGSVGLLALAPGGFAAPPDADDTVVSRLEAALEALEADWSTVAPPADASTPARLAALRRRYQEVGVENPFAAEEHAEISTRLGELESQRDDLVRAIASTRALIADLERLIVEQFQATFHALEVAFERRFGQLFGGGTARLSLTDPADPAASGVEIVARPPGKKAQALAMLSGGERALTAVALLFAMLEVRPVPFCVLDEVDAALDEANIGRFSAALRDLAGTIQFVVITHNRGTIEQADALYGVTIGDDAVSRVVSLRLEPARTSRPTEGPSAAPTGGDGRRRGGHRRALPIERAG